MYPSNTEVNAKGAQKSLLEAFDKISIVEELEASKESTDIDYISRVQQLISETVSPMTKKRKKSYALEEYLKKNLENGSLVEGHLQMSSEYGGKPFVLLKDGRVVLVNELMHPYKPTCNDVAVIDITGNAKPTENLLDNCNIEPTLTGEVIYVKKNYCRKVTVGKIVRHSEDGNENLFCCRIDNQLPLIRVKGDLTLLINSIINNDNSLLYAVEFMTWDNCYFPEGKIVEVLGKSGDIDVETKSAFKVYECERVPYPIDFRIFYPDTDFMVPDEEYKLREDLRNICTFTIDPPGAFDLDDALSVKELNNGNFEIGVHIADVSYFFKPDTPFDAIVRMNATSVYFHHKVYHLLPDRLIRLLTLKPGKDKLVISVFTEFTPEGGIISIRYGRSIINSCVQLSYDNVQMILDDHNNESKMDYFLNISNGFTLDECIKNIFILRKIANKMFLERNKNGSIILSKIELKVGFCKETKTFTSLIPGIPNEAKLMVEEFMLHVNKAVAEMLNNIYPDIVLLRSHHPPYGKLVLELEKKFKLYGLDINLGTSKDINDTLVKYKNERVFPILKCLIGKLLNKAFYCCSSTEYNSCHFGLNIPLYTHFTSPIRRYADIIVHRLLCSALGFTSKENWSPSYIDSVADDLNRITSNVIQVENTLHHLSLQLYFKQRGPQLLKCVAFHMNQSYIDVISLEYGFSVKIYLELLNDAKNIFLRWDQLNHVSSINIEWTDTISQEICLTTELYVSISVNQFDKLHGILTPPIKTCDNLVLL